jgi:energy-coupling factor transporter ATP-binding protein EcfA2
MNVLTLNHNAAATLIRVVGDSNTVLLQGQPGIGKSALLSSLARQMPDYHAAYIDAAVLDLGDIAMPVVDREQMVTNYAPNARFGVGRGQNKPVLLMLDELGKASRPVMNMLLPTILEHRIGDVQLPKGSIVFATTNLATDGVGDNIPAHAHNRMTVCRMANPTVDEWLSWAAVNDIAPEVMKVAHEYPQMFTCYADIGKNDTNPYIFNPLTGNTKAFVSPRSLEKASNLIKNREALGDALLPALAGTIGEAGARDMEAMVQLADSLPNYDAILSDPKKTRLPAGAGAYFLMAFKLAGRAESGNMDAIMDYMARWDSFEAVALFTTQLCGNATKVGMASRNRKFTALAASSGKYF